MKSRRSRKVSNVQKYKVPVGVKNAALNALKLKEIGFGGTWETGRKRARQLATASHISAYDVKMMKAWFARHQHQSKISFDKWVAAGKPITSEWKAKHGILSWVSWGSTAGMKWVNRLKVK